MVQIAMSRLNEIMLVLYAITLVLYFIDYLNKNKLVHRTALWTLVIVYIMQTASIVWIIIDEKRFPILSLFDGVYFYAWLLITVSIILHLFYKVGYAVFFLNVIGFTFMTIHTFAPEQIKQSSVGDALLSELLFIHISFAILSYVAFAMTFVFAVLYLLLYKILKKREWSKQSNRLPSLHQTVMGMKVGIITGIPLLLISLILGMQWAHIVFDTLPFFDIKIFSSFFLLILYSVVLLAMQKGVLRGNNLAWANVFAFLVLLINFFLGSTLSRFHFWF